MARRVVDPDNADLDVWPIPATDIPPVDVPATAPTETVAESRPVSEVPAEPAPGETPAAKPRGEVATRVNESFDTLLNPRAPEDILPGWGPAPTPVTEGLAELTRTKIDRQESVFRQTEQRLEEDRARMNSAIKATGVQPGELQPWDQEQQRAKYATDPLQSFGSIGSVFAILASAFTRDPMTNALNGAAAAMGAIKDGNDKEYARAYDAWQKNNDLAVKRHNIQQHAYDNAVRMMDSDINLGRAKLQMEAARFGDQKTLWLLENGMDKEVMDLQKQRTEAIKAQVEVSTLLTQDGFRREVFKGMMKDYNTQAAELSGQSPAEIAGRKLALFNHVFGKAIPVPQEAFGLLLLGMPDQPIEKVIQKAQDMGIMPHRIGSTSMNTPAEIARRAKAYEEDPNSPTFGDHAASYDRAAKEVKAATATPAREGTKPEFVARRVQELLAETPEMSRTDAEKRALEEWSKANQSRGNTDLTIDRQNAAAVAAAKEKWRKEGVPEEEIAAKGAQMAAQLKAAATPPSGNRRDQLASQIDRHQVFSETINKVEALLKKHRALTGLGGTITRPAEVVSNWFGSNETDRAQFRRYIEELREWGPRLINESNSRPLSSEEKRIAAIVPGLNPGDTTANTARGLYELQKINNTFRQQLIKRREGTWTPESLGESRDAPAKAAPGGKMPWSNDPIDQPAPGKRSELDDESRVASDESDYPVEGGQQYAMMARRDPIGGRPRGEGGGGGGGGGSGFNKLERMREQAEQQGIKDNLPAPRNWRQDLEYRTQDLSRDGVLQADVVWARARELANTQGTSFSEAFRNVGNIALKARDMRLLTDREIADAVMNAARHGIK